MSKKKPEESKISIEDLQKKIKDVKKLADDSKAMLEDKMKKKPLESAAMIFCCRSNIRDFNKFNHN